MAIYTGVADVNGDFKVPFSSSYTGGQKITVTAEKDGAIKTIELHAPSEVVGGGSIQFGGSLENFPQNIGAMIFSSDVKSISDYAFYSAGAGGNTFASSATALEFEAVEAIGEHAFYGFTSVQKIDFPDSLISIGANAFQNCNSCTNVKMGGFIKSIGANAFAGCSEIVSVNIPDSVTSLGAYAFESCRSAIDIYIGTAITSIPNNAFTYCSSLTSIIIPANVQSLGSYALGALSSLSSLSVKRGSPPTITSDTLYELPSTCKIYVPAASLSAYKAAANWKVHASKMIGI